MTFYNIAQEDTPRGLVVGGQVVIGRIDLGSSYTIQIASTVWFFYIVTISVRQFKIRFDQINSIYQQPNHLHQRPVAKTFFSLGLHYEKI